MNIFKLIIITFFTASAVANITAVNKNIKRDPFDNKELVQKSDTFLREQYQEIMNHIEMKKEEIQTLGMDIQRYKALIRGLKMSRQVEPVTPLSPLRGELAQLNLAAEKLKSEIAQKEKLINKKIDSYLRGLTELYKDYKGRKELFLQGELAILKERNEQLYDNFMQLDDRIKELIENIRELKKTVPKFS